MNPNIRRENETQKEFRARRREENLNQRKRQKRGSLLWNSKTDGTYVRKIHGVLK